MAKKDAASTARAAVDSLPVKGDWSSTSGVGERRGLYGISGRLGLILSDLGTLFILAVTPWIALFVYQIHSRFNGSVTEFVEFGFEHGFAELVRLLPGPTWDAAAHVAVFGLLQTVLLLGLPCNKFQGPITPKGNTPVYNANGLESYIITFLLLGVAWRFGYFSPAHVYDIMGEILVVLNIFAFALCFCLTVKGKVAPSYTDCGSAGNLLQDFYWGTELHPRLGRSFYVKQWTNCRMGMTGWAVLVVCFALKSYDTFQRVDLAVWVCALLQVVYLAKFFLWEMGYMCTMDIQHDRAGYMICWGCLVWVPGIYTSTAMYLATHPTWLSPPLAGAMFAAGLLMIWINWDADNQRMVFRKKHGLVTIWGSPARLIRATYKTGKGEEKESLLLASGWWGVARHWHYVPELLAAFLWSAPALFDHVLPYFYFIFLTILLTDRCFRDEARCASKYGKHWDEYCTLVPYRMIPYVF